METIFLIQYRIPREMKKTDTQSQTPKNKDRLSQGTQRSPQEHPERRNPARNH
jgi:hypothetical protein